MISPHADVAELADAQVSEACDGDIVEVQVLSSAPVFYETGKASSEWARFFFLFETAPDLLALIFGTMARLERIYSVVTYSTNISIALGLSYKESEPKMTGVPNEG